MLLPSMYCLFVLPAVVCFPCTIYAFVQYPTVCSTRLLQTTFPTTNTVTTETKTSLYIHRSIRSTPRSNNSSNNNSSSRRNQDKSKRQCRVGELVKTELAQIIYGGVLKGSYDYLEDSIRCRISIVGVDVSPDLRQARVSVSIRGSGTPGTSSDDGVLEKRQAYSWLVENTKAIRHTLAQRMSHMKTSPTLSFVQVDVSAAVDVIYLIDKVSKGYQRERIGEFGGNDDNIPRGYLPHDEYDAMREERGDDDEDDWEEEDNDFFES